LPSYSTWEYAHETASEEMPIESREGFLDVFDMTCPYAYRMSDILGRSSITKSSSQTLGLSEAVSDIATSVPVLKCTLVSVASNLHALSLYLLIVLKAVYSRVYTQFYTHGYRGTVFKLVHIYILFIPITPLHMVSSASTSYYQCILIQ
jgi:hypothetical protein